MAYIDAADLAEAASFKRRVAPALVDVAAEVLTGGSGIKPAVQAKKYELALNVIRDPYVMVPAFIWPIIADATIAGKGLASTDAEIKARIALVWEYVAGVTAADRA